MICLFFVQNQPAASNDGPHDPPQQSPWGNWWFACVKLILVLNLCLSCTCGWYYEWCTCHALVVVLNFCDILLVLWRQHLWKTWWFENDCGWCMYCDLWYMLYMYCGMSIVICDICTVICDLCTVIGMQKQKKNADFWGFAKCHGMCTRQSDQTREPDYPSLPTTHTMALSKDWRLPSADKLDTWQRRFKKRKYAKCQAAGTRKTPF
jgi:hypothetical protein